MAQPSVAAFFNTRKHAAAEDVASIKNRLLDNSELTQQNTTTESQSNDASSQPQQQLQDQQDDIAALKKMGMSTRSTRSSTVVKRIGVQDPVQLPDSGLSPKKESKVAENIKQQKKLTTTPKLNTRQKQNEQTPTSNKLITAFTSKNNVKNVEKGLKTPTKQIIKGSNSPFKQDIIKSMAKKELNFNEIKKKITHSAKLQELKASLARFQELEKTRKAQEERNRNLKEGLLSPALKTPTVQLKEYHTNELEVLTSTSKIGSPSKMVAPPAYQRFMYLAERNKAGQLALPYKYRHLIEIFKAMEAVCAMFYNRKECITFKKLKSAVQSMMRKNFDERHLGQIKHLYPEAFIFTQMKMHNYGSASKDDNFQLVITPNVESLPEKSYAMNPHVMTERLQKFQAVLLEKVKNEHDKFLKSLDPPLSVPKEKLKRWHPDFDLENCAEIELDHLPQTPNVEKYSSAKDILSTATNLFNCSTPIEKIMEKNEAKLETDKNLDTSSSSSKTETITKGEPSSKENFNEIKTNTAEPVSTSPTTTEPLTAASDSTLSLLKGLPESLLEKIRDKQAAKGLDAMTCIHSQDLEAINYSCLPELARHLRNVFIAERKVFLTQELIIKKLQNCFRTRLTQQEIENILQLMAKEVPAWFSFHEVRKTMYLKINKDMDITKIIERLETVANV